MREIAGSLLEWRATGTAYAVATVVDVQGSSPRGPGAAMAVTADGAVVGSLSGGCVEGAVVEAAQQALRSGAASLQTYGVSDEDAFSVGLTCGGTLQVLVQPVGPADRELLADVASSVVADRPVALVTVISGPAKAGAAMGVWPDRLGGSLGDDRLDAAVVADARGLLAQGVTGHRWYGAHGERTADEVLVFVQAFTTAPRMLVFGAVDFAAAVAEVGVFLGYHVTVCDARAVFATRSRFPAAHDVVCEWPHRYLQRAEVDDRTVICVLTHDPKFDVPVLQVALRRPAAFIGAMGSRRTHADRLRRLRDAGLTEQELARLASPIGLDIGARTPQETAVSIAAQIIQARWGGSGQPLRATSGPIHGDVAQPVPVR